MAGKRKRFGNIRELPSGRFQASYLHPHGVLTDKGLRVRITTTYVDEADAEFWLTTAEREISRGTWRHPNEVAANDLSTVQVTFGTYARKWLRERHTRAGLPLAPGTVQSHERALRLMVYPTFEHVALSTITPAQVRTWHAELGTGRPAQRIRAYSVFRAICGTAVEDKLLAINPCTIKGAGRSAKSRRAMKLAALPELDVALAAMPENLRITVVLATWCALRSGEVRELRRGDIEGALIKVTRAVTWVKGRYVIGKPKSDAGIRDVTIPPHVLADVTAHLERYVGPDKDALLVTSQDGGTLPHSTLQAAWDRSRMAAGRPDLRFHDLRHTGLTFAAQAGATTRELMERGGHSNPAVALIYQHSTTERQELLARRLSELAAGDEGPALRPD